MNRIRPGGPLKRTQGPPLFPQTTPQVVALFRPAVLIFSKPATQREFIMGYHWTSSENEALTEFMDRKEIKPETPIKPLRIKNEFWEDAAAWVFSKVPNVNERRTPDACRNQWRQLHEKRIKSNLIKRSEKNAQKQNSSDNEKRQQLPFLKNPISFDESHLAQIQETDRLRARTVAADGEIQGMVASNKEKERKGQALTYDDKSFFHVLEKYGLKR